MVCVSKDKCHKHLHDLFELLAIVLLGQREAETDFPRISQACSDFTVLMSQKSKLSNDKHAASKWQILVQKKTNHCSVLGHRQFGLMGLVIYKVLGCSCLRICIFKWGVCDQEQCGIFPLKCYAIAGTSSFRLLATQRLMPNLIGMESEGLGGVIRSTNCDKMMYWRKCCHFQYNCLCFEV